MSSFNTLEGTGYGMAPAGFQEFPKDVTQGECIMISQSKKDTGAGPGACG